MARREKFGKFVLLEELETSALGTEFRAAKLGATGLERIVSVLRLSPALSANAETAKGLMDQVKVAAQLQNPNVIRIYGIGRVDALYYISSEFVEGKSLRLTLDRCRRDAFPFSIDHALLISSKICSALEYSHGRRTESGSRYFHGLVNPGNVLISYEGEVRVRGFGHWFARLREAGVLREEDVLHLSPEQAAGGSGDTRSDVFAVGAVLYQMLTGQPLFQGGRSGDIAARLANARLQGPAGEDDRVPKPIADILARTLTQEPSARYAEVQELRKAIDTLLFSGDFTPTTFNLAFFMHSLFRDDIDRESKVIKDEREASYAEFLTEAAAKPGAAGVAPATTPIPRTTPVPRVHAAAAVVAEPPEHEKPPPAPPAHAEPVAPAAPPSGVSAKEAAASFTFHKEAAPRRRATVIAAIVVVVGLLAGAAYYLLGRGILLPRAPATPVPTTLSPEAVAALAKVKELEEKLKAFEEEKAAAEQKAKDEAAAKLQKEAKARGGEVDPAALQKAQEEAAKKARVEQDKKQQEEKRKLEETKAAEETRLAEEQRKAEEQKKAEEAARVAAAAATTTTVPPMTLPPSTTLPPLKPGALVNLTDPGVVAPVVERTAMPVYPEMALRQRIEGSVDLNILVDEKGAVIDAQVTSSAGPGWRALLDESALASVKRRRYKPATKDGVPVKVWISVRVQFKPPA